MFCFVVVDFTNRLYRVSIRLNKVPSVCVAYRCCVNDGWDNDLFLDHGLDGFMDMVMDMLALDARSILVGDDSFCFRLQVLELLLLLC